MQNVSAVGTELRLTVGCATRLQVCVSAVWVTQQATAVSTVETGSTRNSCWTQTYSPV